MSGIIKKNLIRSLVESRKTNPVWSFARSLVSNAFDIDEEIVDEKVEAGIDALLNKKERAKKTEIEVAECEILEEDNVSK